MQGWCRTMIWVSDIWIWRREIEFNSSVLWPWGSKHNNSSLTFHKTKKNIWENVTIFHKIQQHVSKHNIWPWSGMLRYLKCCCALTLGAWKLSRLDSFYLLLWWLWAKLKKHNVQIIPNGSTCLPDELMSEMREGMFSCSAALFNSWR